MDFPSLCMCLMTGWSKTLESRRCITRCNDLHLQRHTTRMSNLTHEYMDFPSLLSELD